MHRVHYCKSTQICLFRMYSRSEHPNRHNMKLHGVGFITAINIVVHINPSLQKLDLISCCSSQILWMLDSFPMGKDMLPLNKSQNFTLSLQLSTLSAPVWLGRYFGPHLLFHKKSRHIFTK
jgi:hypothetical protein